MTQLAWPDIEAAVASMNAEEKRRLLSLVLAPTPNGNTTTKRLTPEEFDTELAKVVMHGSAPALPEDFSRDDIYNDRY